MRHIQHILGQGNFRHINHSVVKQQLHKQGGRVIGCGTPSKKQGEGVRAHATSKFKPLVRKLKNNRIKLSEYDPNNYGIMKHKIIDFNKIN